ncbi:hypothetical protein [Streptomyces sp. NPDC058653]|uniref:hypothetical protein n=1 Tax=Streptomyces sp. NPDC058653 TaxID=3346576 RepID=UPI00364C1CFD
MLFTAAVYRSVICPSLVRARSCRAWSVACCAWAPDYHKPATATPEASRTDTRSI